MQALVVVMDYAPERSSEVFYRLRKMEHDHITPLFIPGCSSYPTGGGTHTAGSMVIGDIFTLSGSAGAIAAKDDAVSSTPCCPSNNQGTK